MKRRADATWPSDTELVALVALHGSMRKVALACGGTRESLRDFLRIRPGLDVTFRAHLRPRLTPEQRAANARRSGREYMARRRAEDNDEVRRQRRESWRRTTTAERRRAANMRARIARVGLAPPDRAWLGILAGDPCAYCGGPCEEIDHVTAIANGGTHGWENLIASCRPCNRMKKAQSLLSFLMARGR